MAESRSGRAKTDYDIMKPDQSSNVRKVRGSSCLKLTNEETEKVFVDQMRVGGSSSSFSVEGLGSKACNDLFDLLKSQSSWIPGQTKDKHQVPLCTRRLRINVVIRCWQC